MNERIQVVGRIRPLTVTEKERGDTVEAHREDNQTIRLDFKSANQTSKKYRLDSVLDYQSNQVNVFERVVPLLDNLLEGYNCSLFAYGQTGKF